MATVSDEALVAALSRFAALTDVALRNPERWFGWGHEGGGGRAGHLVNLRNRVLSGAPGSEQWLALGPEERSEWWVTRISNLAGFLAATPRVFGAAADRVPLQAALGTAVAGVAVCAVAREHGLEDPRDWVPLLGRVLFDRELSRGTGVSERALAMELGQADEHQSHKASLDAGAAPRRASEIALKLAKSLLSLRPLFDERPRGARVFRAMGKVPVGGLVGGWLDERGAVRRAAQATERTLAAR
jgi:hypothetical protein